MVNPGETLELLSERHNIHMKRLLEYNNMTGTEKLEPVRTFYLQPKRKKASPNTMGRIRRDHVDHQP